MQPKACRAAATVLVAAAVALPAGATQEQMYALDWSGDLYTVSMTTAETVEVGNVGWARIGSLESGPGGYLYGFLISSNPVLIRVDPNTAETTTVGPIAFATGGEGAIAFSPSGDGYGATLDADGEPILFRFDVGDASSSIIGFIGEEGADINGLAWRDDGMLVGLDAVQNALVEIDPATAATSVLTVLTPVVGDNGGMAMVGSRGFFATGNGVGAPGSNELWSFDPFTGTHSLVGSFDPAFENTTLSGLAAGLPTLEFLTIRPGIAGTNNFFEAQLALPESEVHVVFSSGLGSAPIPGCDPATVDLAAPGIVGSDLTDELGVLRLERFVPAAASGSTFSFQAVELGTCRVSDVFTFTWP